MPVVLKITSFVIVPPALNEMFPAFVVSVNVVSCTLPLKLVF